jgi:hypothetical protein
LEGLSKNNDELNAPKSIRLTSKSWDPSWTVYVGDSFDAVLNPFQDAMAYNIFGIGHDDVLVIPLFVPSDRSPWTGNGTFNVYIKVVKPASLGGEPVEDIYGKSDVPIVTAVTPIEI